MLQASKRESIVFSKHARLMKLTETTTISHYAIPLVEARSRSSEAQREKLVFSRTNSPPLEDNSS